MGEWSRFASASSRSPMRLCISSNDKFIPLSMYSANRLLARAFKSAVKNTLRSAFGKTTVAVSRPSATMLLPVRPAFFDMPPETLSPHGVGKSWRPHRSSPDCEALLKEVFRRRKFRACSLLSKKEGVFARADRRTSSSSGCVWPCPAKPAFSAKARARYMAPVSRYTKPSLSASNLQTVLFPAPAGPSTAIITSSTPRKAWSSSRFQESKTSLRVSDEALVFPGKAGIHANKSLHAVGSHRPDNHSAAQHGFE